MTFSFFHSYFHHLLVLLTTSLVTIVGLAVFFLWRRSSSGKSTLSVEPPRPLVAPKEPEPEVDDGKKKVTVFFGTQTGTAEGFAKALAEEAKARYDKAVFRVVDLDDYAADDEKMKKESLALFFLATEGKVHVHAANGKGLVGGRFHLDFPSVGATETLMMAASMAEGVTTLSNAALEPEVVNLAEFLNASGACIEGAGTSTIVVTGRKRLYGAGHTVIPDRIEAGTFMAAAAIARSCITLSPVVPSHMISVLEKLSAAGCKITQTARHALQISAEATGGTLRGFDLETLPYPGFPTDLQPQFMALQTTCAGSSNVVESVFEKRMHHVEELKKLGAEIKVAGNSALTEGKKAGATLSGCRVNAADLRGGAALVLAGLAAAGVTEVSGAAHIDRGYENFERKLRSLGADIKRVGEM